MSEGSQNETATFEVEGYANTLGATSGPYAADINEQFSGGGGYQNIEQPGTWLACAYLLDYDQNTLAYSPHVFSFTVKNPASPTSAEAFGGPAHGPHNGHPSDLTLRVAPEQHPTRAGHRVLFKVTGTIPEDSTTDPLLLLTSKSTRNFNGCAGTSSQDEQIARSTHGGVLADDDQMTDDNGHVSAYVSAQFLKGDKGSVVICAYAQDVTDAVAVGYYRFTSPTVAKR